MQLYRDGDRARLFTKNGHDWRERYPHLTAAALRMRLKRVSIDAELVVAGDDGIPDFQRIISGRHDGAAQLVAHDLLMLDGQDWRKRPFAERKARLAALLREEMLLLGKAIILNEHEAGDGATLFRHACKLGLEGIVSKRADSPYVSGRSPYWRKLKNPESIAVKREAEIDWSKRNRRRRP